MIMAKTWYGHHIENIKGEDYVLFKDYLELDKEIERLNNIIDELEKDFKDKGLWYSLQKVQELKEGKVIKEIPQFEGTLEQLDNLCDIKNKGE